MTARWYVIHVYSGFEKKVAQSIREQAEQKGLAEKFEEVLVPTEEVVEVQARRQGQLRAQVLPRLRAGEDGFDRRDLASRQEHAEGHGLPRRQGPAGADQRGRGDPHHAPGPGRHRAAEAVDHLRDRRAGARVATVRSPRSTASSRKSTRRRRGSRWRCRSSAARRRSSSNTRRSRRFRDQTMAKKVVGFIKLQVPAGKANPSPPIGPALGSARPQHHGVLQGVQRADPEAGAGHADPGGHHRLWRSQLHLHHQVAAELLFPDEGGGHREGLADAGQGHGRQGDDERRSATSRRRRWSISTPRTSTARADDRRLGPLDGPRGGGVEPWQRESG